jgi:signal transduction histidine kinase
MRLSLKNQILIPIVVIQLAATAAIAATTAWFSARRVERQVIARLVDLVETLDRANFPYTAGVLGKMHGLSGAHFIALDNDAAVATSLPESDRPRPSDLRAASVGRLESLGASPRLTLGGRWYLAAAVRSPGEGRGHRRLVILYPEADLLRARRDAAVPPLLLGLAALGVMASATSWTAHRISRRIRRVERQVARIAAGHFEEMEDGGAGDEVRDLVASINRMGEQLREQREAIRKAERAGVLAQLAAGLAHQLRNALTGARMSIQLHARRFPTQDRDPALDVALRQLTIVEEQVRGLLTLGRGERRRLAETDLASLVAEVASLVGPACQHAKVGFVCDTDDGPARLVADGPALRSAVLNLTLNAIEAAGGGGQVRLSVGRESRSMTIEVRDNGPGPPSELAENLGEPFLTGKLEGIGLGLALARRVAAEHGGQLSWNRIGDETCFRVELPREPGPRVGGAG